MMTGLIAVVVVVYLATAMYYSYGQRPSPSVDRWYMVWMTYDGHMITGEECGPNFLTFVLRLRENPGRNLNPKTDPTEDGIRDRCVRGNDVTPRPIIAIRNKVQPDSLQNSDLCERVLKGNLVWIYVQPDEECGCGKYDAYCPLVPSGIFVFP